jgi:peptide/nickel transport system substrate-binding protein
MSTAPISWLQIRRRRPIRRCVASLAAALALLLLIISAAAAAPDKAKTAQTINIGVSWQLPTMDPTRQTNPNGDSICLELLMKLTPTGQVEPNLAQSVTQPTPATYVYHLRHGVRFWDGNEMTSADVANAINYQRYPGGLDTQFYTDVKSVKATDKYDVTITLKHPDAGWRYVFAFTGYIWEKKFQDEHKATFGQPGTLVMGTGPYIVKSVDPTQGAEFVANPHYWGGNASIQQVGIKVFSTEQSEALAFRAGDIDLAFPTSTSFAATANTKLIEAASPEQDFFTMNTRFAPFNNVHVRRAIAYAINPKDVIAAAGGGATADYTMMPPITLRELASQAQVNALIKSLHPYEFNLAKAKAELAQSPNPQGFTFTFNTISYGTYTSELQAIAGDLSRVGITMHINVQATGDWLKAYYTTTGLTGLYSYFAPLSPDPGYIPQLIYTSKGEVSGGLNAARYSTTQLDSLVTEAQTASNPQKRFAIYSKLLSVVQPLALYVPIYVKNNFLAIDSKFSFSGFNGYSGYNEPFILQIKRR